MPGKLGNYGQERALRYLANLDGGYDIPATLEGYFGSTSFDANGNGTVVPGSLPTPLDNTAGLINYSGGRLITIGPITTGVRPSGGDQLAHSLKVTEVGFPSRVYYYGDLNQDVSWPQGEAISIPPGALTVTITTA